MATYYFDSSATVKRFAKEKGTSLVLGLMRPSTKIMIYAERIAEVEVFCGSFLLPFKLPLALASGRN